MKYYGFDYSANFSAKPIKRSRVRVKSLNRVPSLKVFALITIAILLLSGAGGYIGGYLASNNFSHNQATVIQPLSAYPVTEDASGIRFNAAKVAAACMNSVVEIKTEVVKRGGFIGQYVSEGAGSGVIISNDGYIVTNNHVVAGANRLNITLRNGKNYSAKLIGKDSKTDLAVLKIDETKLPAATMGSSGSLVVGEPVLAVGNPLGELGGTVTDGIISALDREIDIDNQKMTLLQTNASINPGNSGGGLFNSQGLLIGIVNAKSSGSGIEGLGFAIPIDTAKLIIEEIIEYGYVTGRIDLGMSLTEVSSFNAFLNGLRTGGVYITHINPGSNAERAGFLRGDRIVSISGKEVNNAKSVNEILESYSVSDTVRITIDRNGRQLKIDLKLAEANKNATAVTLY